MIMLRTFAVATAAALLLAGCATMRGGDQLSGDQIGEMLAGRTLESGGDVVERVTFARYGGAVVERETGTADIGRWHVAGDALCVQWQNEAAGTERCFDVYRVGEGRYELRLNGTTERVLISAS